MVIRSIKSRQKYILDTQLSCLTNSITLSPKEKKTHVKDGSLVITLLIFSKL